MEKVEIPKDKKRSPRILVVDDEVYMRAFNTSTLIRFGYEVDSAIDGVEGWKALQIKHYDLLITDNSMPRVTGVEMVDKMQAAGMAVPVIMATGAMPEHEFKRHPWLRTVTTLRPPFTTNDLLATVEKILNSNGGRLDQA
jgi:DNA-binding NtrC family response regulator